LKHIDRQGYHVPRCMEGTRRDVFRKIDHWLDDTSAPNILWISGSPGAGKSALASSLVSDLTKRRRMGARFFWVISVFIRQCDIFSRPLTTLETW
jgi:DNA replication protein DnaC